MAAHERLFIVAAFSPFIVIGNHREEEEEKAKTRQQKAAAKKGLKRVEVG